MNFSKSFLQMTGGIQHYAWGSRSRRNSIPYIAELLKQPPQGLPWAEFWLGNHPSLPSEVTLDDGNRLPLSELIALSPENILGGCCMRHGFSTLPFLLKILSCDKPLSIQSHPDTATAERLHLQNPGCYPDSNHKPETIIALTHLEALAGFRDFSEILSDLQRHSCCRFWLQCCGETGDLKSLCQALFMLSTDTVEEMLKELSAEEPATDSDLLFRKLHRNYPGDRGTLFAYLLRHFHLKPLESLFLQNNIPHSYIRGVCIECTGNSDNVIRGGLTAKKVDTATLLKTLDFSAGGHVSPTGGELQSQGERVYSSPVPDYRITILTGDSYQFESSPDQSLPGILLVLEGEFLLEAGGSSRIHAERGSSWLKPAALLSGAITPAAPSSLAVWCTPNL